VAVIGEELPRLGEGHILHTEKPTDHLVHFIPSTLVIGVDSDGGHRRLCGEQHRDGTLIWIVVPRVHIQAGPGEADEGEVVEVVVGFEELGWHWQSPDLKVWLAVEGEGDGVNVACSWRYQDFAERFSRNWLAPPVDCVQGAVLKGPLDNKEVGGGPVDWYLNVVRFTDDVKPDVFCLRSVKQEGGGKVDAHVEISVNLHAEMIMQWIRPGGPGRGWWRRS